MEKRMPFPTAFLPLTPRLRVWLLAILALMLVCGSDSAPTGGQQHDGGVQAIQKGILKSGDHQSASISAPREEPLRLLRGDASVGAVCSAIGISGRTGNNNGINGQYTLYGYSNGIPIFISPRGSFTLYIYWKNNVWSLGDTLFSDYVSAYSPTVDLYHGRVSVWYVFDGNDFTYDPNVRASCYMTKGDRINEAHGILNDQKRK